MQSPIERALYNKLDEILKEGTQKLYFKIGNDFYLFM